MNPAAPYCSEIRPIATIGLHSSASTWIFNIVREMLIAVYGGDHIEACYADDVAQIPQGAARRHLIKSHHGSEELDVWLASRRARLILSIRDPRDACISMAMRFNAPLQHTILWIANDCNRITRLVPFGYPLLRYEDRFFDTPSTVDNLAKALDLPLAAAARDEIFSRYETEAVRAFARAVPSLPASRVQPVGPLLMDRITQIHRTHVGDTKSGKWRSQDLPVQREMTRIFLPFLERFGYAP